MTSPTGGHEFLGEEFLSWLWFRTETIGGEFDLGQGRVVGVAFDDLIAFAPGEEDETEQTLRKGTPTRAPEAAAALHSGRRLRRARLIAALGELMWHLTIDGPTMHLLSIKLPDDPEDAEMDERSRERAAYFITIHEIVHAIYREFLRVRLRPDYLETDGERQAEWMSSHA